MNVQEILAPLITAAKTPAQYRALASELERIAALVRGYADAKDRQQAKPPSQRVKTGVGGRPSTPWVQIYRRARSKGDADEVYIRFSTSLYYSVKSPERLDVQRLGGALNFIPSRGDVGYKVLVNTGGIRINASGARDIIPEDGKYAVEVKIGVIVLGARK